MCPPRHRLTFRFTCLVRLIKLSMALVSRLIAGGDRRAEREDGEGFIEAFTDARRALGYRSRVVAPNPAGDTSSATSTCL